MIFFASERMPICIVDCKQSYREAAARNYKYIPIEAVVDDIKAKTVITGISRYEVLKNDIRRLYFDVEKIPEDKPNLIHDFIRDFNVFMKDECSLEKDMNYIITFNEGSATHKGLSYHVIFYEYCMHYRAISECLIAFVHRDLGKPYAEYTDTSIYSRIRLFKLPYYIGLTKEGIDSNQNNYHRVIEDSSGSDDLSHAVIQFIENSELLRHDFDVKLEWKKSAKIISPLWQKGGTAGAIVAKAIKANTEAVSDIILKKLSPSNYEKDIEETNDKIRFIEVYYNHLSPIRQKIANLISSVKLNEQNIAVYKNTVDRLYEQAKAIKDNLKEQT